MGVSRGAIFVHRRATTAHAGVFIVNDRLFVHSYGGSFRRWGTRLRSIARLLSLIGLLRLLLVVTVNAVNVAVVVVLVIASRSLRGLISNRIFILRCGPIWQCCRTELWQWLLWYTQSRKRYQLGPEV